MNTRLITALRRSARALEQSTFDYSWKQPSTCSCGVLACALLDCSSKELTKRLPLPADSPHTWTRMVGQNCSVTGKSMNELLSALMKFGLTPRDLVDLEYLLNTKVLARVQLPAPPAKWYHKIIGKPAPLKLDYLNQCHVAKYMRAWADLLTEEGQKDAAPMAKATEPAPLP